MTTASLIAALALLAGACGGDDDDANSGGTCSCNWGDSCEEYSSGCALMECESNGQDVKSTNRCSQEGVLATCTCASDDYVAYYYDLANAQSDCEFFCDDGVYEEL